MRADRARPWLLRCSSLAPASPREPERGGDGPGGFFPGRLRRRRSRFRSFSPVPRIRSLHRHRPHPRSPCSPRQVEEPRAKAIAPSRPWHTPKGSSSSATPMQRSPSSTGCHLRPHGRPASIACALLPWRGQDGSTTCARFSRAQRCPRSKLRTSGVLRCAACRAIELRACCASSGDRSRIASGASPLCESSCRSTAPVLRRQSATSFSRRSVCPARARISRTRTASPQCSRPSPPPPPRGGSSRVKSSSPWGCRHCAPNVSPTLPATSKRASPAPLIGPYGGRSRLHTLKYRICGNRTALNIPYSFSAPVVMPLMM